MDIPKSSSSLKAFSRLKEIVSKLRSPSDGCPWNQKQTHTSLIPYLLEEAHEVTDAIRNGDENNLKEELGDLLFQIFLHAQIADEDKRFCLKDIAENVSQKLIRRHPHVFKHQQRKSLEDVQRTWEEIKADEKPLNSSNSPLSNHLKQKLRSRSAIAGAIEISKKVSQVGFEWENAESIWSKVDEELDELKEALKKKDFANAQEELGDVLFTIINIARWFQISPEEGLAGTNKRFLDRFAYVESELKGTIAEHSRVRIKKLWELAKISSQPKRI